MKSYFHSYYNKETEELLKKVKGTELEFPVTMVCIYGLRKEEVLGHSTITTTKGIYAHFDDSKHKATITKLSNYLSDLTQDDELGNVKRE